MIDRLVELLYRAHHNASCVLNEGGSEDECLEEEARYLLAEGVIVPPCKVGDTVYHCVDLGDIVYGRVLEIKVISMEIKEKMSFYAKTVKHYRYNYTRFDSTDVGKTVFLTREEAEQALKGEKT